MVLCKFNIQNIQGVQKLLTTHLEFVFFRTFLPQKILHEH